MKLYIGTKIIMAEPMNLGDYNKYRGWIIPVDEDPNKSGYLVKYNDDHKSWSPAEVFEESYRLTNDMNFGLAIEAMKKGYAVYRRGWNGKGIFIALQAPKTTSRITSPYIYINTTGLQTDNFHAPKSIVPWLASQTDMLADDWSII